MKHTVSQIKLKNGARGLLIHIPEATVMTFDYNFRAGEYLVERSKWETPHLLEHLLLGANKLLRTTKAFQAEFEKNGAYCNASTGAYDIIYEAECADFEWDRILRLLLGAITQPLFLQSEFNAEFGNVKEELYARSNNHSRHLSLALRQKYGFCVMTDQKRLELMRNVSLEDIRRHYQRTHTSSNLRFVIAGNIPDTRRKIIKKLMSSLELPKGEEGRIKLPKEIPQKLAEPLYIRNKTIDNLYFYFDTFRLNKMSDAQADGLSLLNTMLTETLYSRILGTAREKGLLYHMNSGFGQTDSSTNWWFGAQVLPANAPKVFKIMVQELQKIQNGRLAKVDITAAKQYSLGRYQRSGQTVGGIANGYSYRYFFDGHIDDYYKVPDRIQAITKPGIIAVSRTLFEQNIWGLGILGNVNNAKVTALQQQLASLW